MSSEKINVEVSREIRPENRPGTALMIALVGHGMDLFEIREDRGVYTYWVGLVQVPAQIYRDCMMTCDKDRYDETQGDDEDEETEPQPELS